MKKMNYYFAAFAVMAAMFLWSFRAPDSPAGISYEWKDTTLESAVGAGFGRSRVIMATADESKIIDNYQLENIFSATGINFDNVTQNEKAIVNMITDAQKEGWDLFSVTSNTLNADTKRQRLFITRYLFRKPM